MVSEGSWLFLCRKGVFSLWLLSGFFLYLWFSVVWKWCTYVQFLFVFLYLSVLVSPELPESGLLFDTNLRIFCHCFKYYFLFLSFTSGILITCMLYLLRCSTVLACVLSCFSHVWLCATLWMISCQAPLSMGFSRQGYWSGLPFPTPGNLK